MSNFGKASIGRLCWMDLAATDERAAVAFYEALFGWTSGADSVGDGVFRRFAAGDRNVASVYQLRERHLIRGVPSHWTPYVAVADAQESADRAEALGAAVIVKPFAVPGAARIALIQDPIGAPFGLWQQSAANPG